MPLSRSDLTPPTLPRETVPVPGLGGEVIVQALTLTERLRLVAESRDADPFAHVPRLLARCIVQPDGASLLTETEWEAFGARHPGETLDLLTRARRLSGLDPEDAEKN